MSSVKSWMVGVVAGAATVGSFGAFAQVPTLVVGNHSQSVQTPTTVPSGVVYQATGPQNSTLTAYTEGFLFCGNVGGAEQGLLVSIAPQHEDQTITPAHPWTLPSALALDFSYSNGRFLVEPGATLACHSLGNQGEVVSGLVEGIFDNGYDSKAETNYNHLVNWTPSVGFDWNQPDWTQVPKDACVSTANQPAKVIENEACAAVTGVRSAGTSPSVRAATIWTSADAISFTYLFRVDLRYGEQPANAIAEFRLPQADDSQQLMGAPTGLSFMLVDAYDSKLLSATGQYCFLDSESLPTTLNSSVCSGANPLSLNGPMRYSGVVAPPVATSSTFYVAVTRQRAPGGDHTNLATPVVAASVLVEPALTAIGGNKFTGDDVVFGFMPSSNGFPWMSGQ